ncbi:hypothetical protein IV203_004026 [Nitzschia inconspicua]|uniref:Uncharacterized protein n=1 Tax=Nitzschia inconspicua TaxID=303405 RepID=A0A9K3PNY4_9STRA|nr:hypothetical protein IV203_004026 [Nitzschia inconspicua]
MKFSTILLVMLASAAYVSCKNIGIRRLQGGNGSGTDNDEDEEACINDQIVFDLVSVEDGEEAGYLNYTYKFNNTGASNISHWSVIVGNGCTIKDHVCINGEAGDDLGDTTCEECIPDGWERTKETYAQCDLDGEPETGTLTLIVGPVLQGLEEEGKVLVHAKAGNYCQKSIVLDGPYCGECCVCANTKARSGLI